MFARSSSSPARNSSFTYKDQAIDVKWVGRDLGVGYVLEGSVRKAAGRVRITAQLIDAETGAHLWSDRFDGSLEDVFELQEQVAISVAGVIEPTLQAAEAARSVNRPTSDLTAYDLYLRAYATYSTSHQRQTRQALALLAEAIARDPQFGPALAFAAYSTCIWSAPTLRIERAVGRRGLRLRIAPWRWRETTRACWLTPPTPLPVSAKTSMR